MKNLATLLTILSIVLAPAASQDNATCIAESVVLVSDTAIAEPQGVLISTIETDVKDDFMQFCSVLERTCTVDVADYSSALEAACTAEGGQIALKKAMLDCSGKLMNIPVPGGIDVVIDNIPGCVGASCDVDNLPPEIEAVFGMVVEQVKTEVENAIAESDIECGATTTDAGDGSGAVSALGSTLVPVVSVATVSWLFF